MGGRRGLGHDRSAGDGALAPHGDRLGVRGDRLRRVGLLGRHGLDGLGGRRGPVGIGIRGLRGGGPRRDGRECGGARLGLALRGLAFLGRALLSLALRGLPGPLLLGTTAGLGPALELAALGLLPLRGQPGLLGLPLARGPLLSLLLRLATGALGLGAALLLGTLLRLPTFAFCAFGGFLALPLGPLRGLPFGAGLLLGLLALAFCALGGLLALPLGALGGLLALPLGALGGLPLRPLALLLLLPGGGVRRGQGRRPGGRLRRGAVGGTDPLGEALGEAVQEPGTTLGLVLVRAEPAVEVGVVRLVVVVGVGVSDPRLAEQLGAEAVRLERLHVQLLRVRQTQQDVRVGVPAGDQVRAALRQAQVEHLHVVGALARGQLPRGRGHLRGVLT